MSVVPSSLSGNSFFGRLYDLTIYTRGGNAIHFSENVHFTFTVHKVFVRVYQFAEITIYNLDAATETNILENGDSITLSAGYQNGSYGQIFSGNIRQPIRGKEDGTTYFLKLICVDGDDAMNLGICNFVLSNGQTSQQIAQQTARSSSIPFEVKVGLNGPAQPQTQRGKVVFGSPGDTLRSTALNNNAAFYFDDGVGYMTPLIKQAPSSAINLSVPVGQNTTTGLIGMPVQTDQGIRAKVLINPNMKLDTWFHLNNRDIIAASLVFGVPQTLLDLDGFYRIIGIATTGNTRGNDWYMELEAISQAGAVPAMLAQSGQSGF